MYRLTFRRAAGAAAAAAVVTLAQALVAPTSYAGVGGSQRCTDGVNPQPLPGGVHMGGVSSPVTAAYEIWTDFGGQRAVIICYSTSAYGSSTMPGGAPSLTGGSIDLLLRLDTVNPTVTAGAVCYTDQAVVSPSCSAGPTGVQLAPTSTTNGVRTGVCLFLLGVALNPGCGTANTGATYAPGDLPSFTVIPGTNCTVFLGGCLFTAPGGVKVWAGYNTAADTIDIDVLGIDVDLGLLNVPQTCVSTPGVPCP